MFSQIQLSAILAVLAASLSITSYTRYSYGYETTVLSANQNLDNPDFIKEKKLQDLSNFGISKSILSAFILYGLAALILIILTFASKMCLGGDIFGIFTAKNSGLSLYKSIGLMALMYFSHIATEAFARLEMSMSFYAIFFQINVVVIVLADIFINKTAVSMWAYWGGGLVLVASVGTLVISYLRTNQTTHRITTKTIVIAFLSALTCGIALFIDGEIGNKYVFQSNYSLQNIGQNITPFLFYEFLTFFLPACIAFAALWFRLGIKNTYKTSKAMVEMKIPHRQQIKSGVYMYGTSSFFSVGQFVFSVFALTIPSERVLVAAILSLTPFFNTIFDRKLNDTYSKKANCLLSIIAAIGIILIFISKK